MKPTKPRLLLVLLATVFLLAGTAQARPSLYLKPLVHYSQLSSELKSDYTAGGGFALGILWGAEQKFSTGLEISQTEFEGDYDTKWESPYHARFERASCKVTALLPSFRYTFGTKTQRLRPYVEGLIGYSIVTLAANYTDLSGLSLTGGLGAGVNFQLADSVSLETGFRYVRSTTPTDLLYGYDIHYNARIFILAIRFSL
jgi:opacity protein-like surface antigen